MYDWMGGPRMICAYSDSDEAGDQQAGESITGALCMIGTHLVKSWSSRQQIIAPSPAEGELHALFEAFSQAIVIASMANDLRMSPKVVISTDASAAFAVSHSLGLGRVRHIHVQHL